MHVHALPAVAKHCSPPLRSALTETGRCVFLRREGGGIEGGREGGWEGERKVGGRVGGRGSRLNENASIRVHYNYINFMVDLP